MKNKFKFLTAVSALFLLSGCYSVPTGYIGLKVNLYGDGKGSIEAVPPGKYWDTPDIEYHKFPTYLQNVVWTQAATEGSPGDDSVTFQTSEGLSVNADVGFSYSVNPERAIDIFKSHRKGIDAITNIYLRNIIRDSFNTAASTRGVEHIYGKGKSEFIEEVNKLVKDKVSSQGFIVNQVNIVGTMRLPEAVVEALNNKIAATQRAQQRENELRETEAQAKKRLIEVRAEAEANRLKIKQITPELMQYEKIQIQAKLAERWDGKLPQIQTGGGAILSVDKLLGN